MRIMIKSLLDSENEKRGQNTVLHALMGIVLLFVGNAIASLLIDFFYTITKFEPSISIVIVRPLLEIAAVSLLVWLYMIKVLKMPLRGFRICKPRNIIIWTMCAVTFPIAVSAFFILFTKGTFTVSNFDAAQKTRIILRAVFSACLAAGITEELIFRGLIMHLLEDRWNKTIAVVAPSVCFGLLHILNMQAPKLLDIIVLAIAGTTVGIMFSLIAMESGSIWASALVHGLWNLVIIGDILEIGVDSLSSIYVYTLTSRSTLLTGGAFGIESSLPSIIGYIVVICIALILLKGQNRKSASNTPL